MTTSFALPLGIGAAIVFLGLLACCAAAAFKSSRHPTDVPLRHTRNATNSGAAGAASASAFAAMSASAAAAAGAAAAASASASAAAAGGGAC
ncbi:hypothetical protein HK405_006460 [Cladochytrium tenue]|nr:hypothetical protein HK405_006460 [Cladochytrium tenue]